MIIIPMNGVNSGGNVIKMANDIKPELAKKFEDMLWVNTPEDWILKSTYFKKTLFISALIPTSQEGRCQKIRRHFKFDVIQNRSKDLWGLASDCVDEMKTEVED